VSRANARGEGDEKIAALEEEVRQLKSRLRDLEGGDLKALTGLRTPYVNLVEALGAGIFLYQEEKILFVNEIAERITGYSKEELLRLSLFDLIHPDDRDVARRAARDRRGGLAIPRYVQRIVTKHGAVRWVSFVGQNVDVDGRHAVVGYGTDVTELELAQQALKRDETLFRGLAESTSAIIFVHRGEEMIYVNPAAVRICGYSVDEFQRMGFAAVVHPDFRELVHERGLRRLSGVGPNEPYDVKILTKSGAERYIEITGAPIVLDGLPAVLGTAVDVTERKRAEREMLRAQKLESLGILAGGIAHDFNNIMTAVVGNLSLARAQMRRGGAGAADLLESAERAILGSRHLTQQLLTFSKGGEPVMGPVDVETVIRETSALALSGSMVQLDLDIETEIPDAHADEGQLRQVVSNLVINAMQAMEGRGRLRVGARERTIGCAELAPLAAGRYIEIAVTDEGVGIPTANLPLVFDPYFTTKSRGTGLGLSAAHSIVRKHEGHIEIESELGRGTTVRVLVPASQTRSSHPVFQDRPADGGRDGRLLVMDDDDAVRTVVALMLRQAGYEVTTAREGGEVVEMFAEARRRGAPFDVVLLDLTVAGGMDGREAIRRIRALDPDVRAIVSSGYSDDPILSDHRRYGFCSVVVKPYSEADLCAAVRDAMLGSCDGSRG
jgi:two-component system, cell cycle sensor histidine kinase and response regulator CckA